MKMIQSKERKERNVAREKKEMIQSGKEKERTSLRLRKRGRTQVERRREGGMRWIWGVPIHQGLARASRNENATRYDVTWNACLYGICFLPRALSLHPRWWHLSRLKLAETHWYYYYCSIHEHFWSLPYVRSVCVCWIPLRLIFANDLINCFHPYGRNLYVTYKHDIHVHMYAIHICTYMSFWAIPYMESVRFHTSTYMLHIWNNIGTHTWTCKLTYM